MSEAYRFITKIRVKAKMSEIIFIFIFKPPF